jgi:hypothetical protein
LTALGIICAAQLALIAFLVWRQGRSADPRPLVELVALADRMAQRIQDPSSAVLEHHELTSPPPSSPTYAPPALLPDDDDAFWESREDLARRMMSEELDGSER